MLIYINGEYTDSNIPGILTSDRGFLLGDGIFTTLKVIKSNIVHFQAHYQRLKSNSNVIHLPFSYTEASLKDICLNLIKLNNLELDTLIMRISLTRGKSQRGIDIPVPCNPTIVITIAVSNTAPPKPISLNISTYKRNEYSPICHIKTPNYLEAILARQEAQQLKFDDAILTNTKGDICETTTANLFFVQNKQIYTPCPNDGILPGITREFIIELAEKLEIPVIQTTIGQNEINGFDEAFVTNCAVGVQRVTHIGKHVFLKDDITNMIYNQYFSMLCYA